MNYGDLLYKALENKCNDSNKEVRCYKTKFSAPKKLTRTKVSSDNIKRFLAKKMEEKKRKLQDAEEKKMKLLELRNQANKAKRRIQVMLKRKKSANKSVMTNAVDNFNTIDISQGLKQCDEDDYGYVSQEASAFYEKLMNKYINGKPAEPSSLFTKNKEKVVDLAAAKDRVKMSLQKETEEAKLPQKRGKKLKSKPNNEMDSLIDGSEAFYCFKINKSVEKCTSKESINKQNKKANDFAKTTLSTRTKHCSAKLPPPNFNELLEVAKLNQHQPIIIKAISKESEPKRLMTNKEKAEYQQEEERKLKQLKREKERCLTQSLDKKALTTISLSAAVRKGQNLYNRQNSHKLSEGEKQMVQHFKNKTKLSLTEKSFKQFKSPGY